MDGFEVEPVGGAAEWDAFVAQSPHGSAFATSWFLTAMGEDVELLLVRSGGTAVLGCPVVRAEAIPAPQPRPFTMYQGPMISRSASELPAHRRIPLVQSALEALVVWMAERYTRQSYSLHHRWDDGRAIAWYNYGKPGDRFAFSPRWTAVLDLARSSHQEWIAGIRQNRQRDIRKAEKSGLTCRVSDDIAQLSRLYLLTFSRQGIEVDNSNIDRLARLAAASLRAQSGFILGCFEGSGDTPVSANLIIHDSRAAYYLVGANDPAGRSSGAASLVMSECVRRCREMGLREFDFVGINSPARGDFKISFNGEPRLYFDVALGRA